MVLDGKYVVFEPPQPAASSSVVALRLNRNSPNGFPRFGEEGSTRRFRDGLRALDGLGLRLSPGSEGSRSISRYALERIALRLDSQIKCNT